MTNQTNPNMERKMYSITRTDYLRSGEESMQITFFGDIDFRVRQLQSRGAKVTGETATTVTLAWPDGRTTKYRHIYMQ